MTSLLDGRKIKYMHMTHDTHISTSVIKRKLTFQTFRIIDRYAPTYGPGKDSKGDGISNHRE